MLRRTLILLLLVPAAAAAATPALTANHLTARRGAWAYGRVVRSGAIFTDRVFSDATHGFALADGNRAQYPVRTVDGGRVWRVCGPQLHVDAADAPEAVGFVAVAGRRTFVAYGSGAIDVTTDAGRTWWQTFPGGEVRAVSRESAGALDMFLGGGRQLRSTDGGRHWR